MGAMTSFQTPEPITAVIDVVAGDVRITAGDRTDTVVEVQPSDASDKQDVKAAELTRVDYTDGQLVVKAPKLRSWLPRSDGGSIDVTVELPAGSHLHASGQLADFGATGRLGHCRVKSGIGRVELDEVGTLSVKTGIGDVGAARVAGHADVATGSGDVRLGDLEATAVVKNSNGDTWIGHAAGDLRVSAANGSVAVDRADATMVAKSSNGDVRLGEATRGSVVLETRLGDVEVGIPEGTAAWLDVRAGAGRVHNALEAADTPGPAAEKVEVRARTTAGNVVIGRPR
jgi:Putative adhesin